MTTVVKKEPRHTLVVGNQPRFARTKQASELGRARTIIATSGRRLQVKKAKASMGSRCGEARRRTRHLNGTLDFARYVTVHFIRVPGKKKIKHERQTSALFSQHLSVQDTTGQPRHDEAEHHKQAYLKVSTQHTREISRGMSTPAAHPEAQPCVLIATILQQRQDAPAATSPSSAVRRGYAGGSP